MAWQITVDGHVFRERDVTIDDVEAMEGVTGETWRTLHPLRSATMGKQIAICLLERRAGYAPEAARKLIGEMTLDQFLDCIGGYDPDDDMPSEYVDGVPQSADGTSTPT